jgi:hypothetical protein
VPRDSARDGAAPHGKLTATISVRQTMTFLIMIAPISTIEDDPRMNLHRDRAASNSRCFVTVSFAGARRRQLVVETTKRFKSGRYQQQCRADAIAA